MRIIGFLGIFVLLAIAWSFSRFNGDRSGKIPWKMIAWGLGLQWALALLVLGVPALGFEGPLKPLFNWANDVVVALLGFTNKGSDFIFGSLLSIDKHGFVFALQVLPTIVFFSSLVAIAYHLGIMQKVIGAIAKVMQKTLGTSGAESMSAAANIFVGQTEAPLLVRPFLDRMTKSELMAIMTGGMATVAGGVMAAYVGLLIDVLPSIAGHLMTASVMSAPAGLLVAKLMVPETQTPETMGHLPKAKLSSDVNILEAATRGASEGIKLAINVGGMLLAFIALIALLNAGLSIVGGWVGFESWGASLTPDIFLKDGQAELSLQVILGWVFAPLAFVMGVPWAEAVTAGAFLGEKIAVNEFVAYLHLSQIASQLSERTLIILSYALCGFANFSSIAIQLGGLGSLAPGRKSDLAELGFRSVIGGSIAAFMTAAVAGILI